jgi:hypothetical protein
VTCVSELFQWVACLADVTYPRNGEIAQSYIHDVVEPSLLALERQMSALHERLDDPAAVFGIEPLEGLLRATLLGYCLSLQALWEKQLRGYLRECAHQLGREPASGKRIDEANWPKLNQLFYDLRGVHLTEFVEEYEDLNLLQLLANVCRHGEGGSLDRLVADHPELWPHEPRDQCVLPPAAYAEPARTAANLEISLSLLRSLAHSIASFWSEIEYIYNESIRSKHSSLVRTLAKERQKRSGRGRRWDVPG